MPKFSYHATNADGKTVNGVIESVDRNTAVSTLTKGGLRPITMQLITGNDGKMGFSLKSKKVKTEALVIFTRQLSTMISAGVPLLRALTTLQGQSESPALRDVLEFVVKDVQSGMSLGDAFGKHSDVFSDVFVNMVRAGEAAGILDDILKRLAVQQEKNASMRKKIKSAMTYPTVLIVMTIAAFFGLMLFVVPQIGKIVTDLSGPDAEMPMLTQVMLGVSDFMRSKWYVIIGVLVIGGFFLKRYIKTPKGKYVFHSLILKTPAIKVIVTKVAVARFARTFASLTGAGVSVIESLKVTGRAIGNTVYEKEIDRAIAEVKNGKQLSKAMSNSPLFPAIVTQMLAVGEETGQTDTVLIKVADFYEEEVDALIDGISSIIEPVMIVIMGSMVGLIAASVMGPISSLANTIE